MKGMQSATLMQHWPYACMTMGFCSWYCHVPGKHSAACTTDLRAVPAGRQSPVRAFALLPHSWPHAAQVQAVSAWTPRPRWLLWPDKEAVMRYNSSQGQTNAGDQQCPGPQHRTPQLTLESYLQLSAVRTERLSDLYIRFCISHKCCCASEVVPHAHATVHGATRL